MASNRDAEFSAYVQGRYPALRRTAYLLCRDWHHADDLLQIALAKLYVAWARVRRADNADAYVRQVIVRTFLDDRRRPWRRESATEILDDRGVPALTTDVENRLVLLNAIATLSARQRAVVVLRCWEDLSVADTAHALGCSEGAVKTHLSRALAALRTVLTGAEPTLEGHLR